MPQMAPISWLTLYFIFILTLFLFLAQNYFTKIDSLEKNSKSIYKSKLNWKW
uniref:ATP synthase complex subunit 8 n=1 Tax=Colasposoma dauricum TaxID=1301243 RepID=A0A7U1AQ97_9CUCU|nr:ATP synthase F0 subunit 8 [Colasposoma dauricum]AST15004.1 ATP synthase F0 subunit 8 [Colasposoma dauricum]QQY84938.1 ATP synthase F0 subunit 8 [Colasposoma dauricum]